MCPLDMADLRLSSKETIMKILKGAAVPRNEKSLSVTNDSFHRVCVCVSV